MDDERLQELMRGYQSGRLEAFEGLYAELATPLRQYLASLARDRGQAADLLQDTFLQIHPIAPHVPAGAAGPAAGSLPSRGTSR